MQLALMFAIGFLFGAMMGMVGVASAFSSRHGIKGLKGILKAEEEESLKDLNRPLTSKKFGPKSKH